MRFPSEKSNGGAWLNTGYRRTPTVVIEQDELEMLLEDIGLEDVEDLSGGYFAVLGRLRQGQSGKLLLFADDLEWFAFRPFDADELN